MTRLITLILFLLLLPAAESTAGVRTLLAVGMGGPPQVLENGDVLYAVDLVFDSLPRYAWSRYDVRRSKLVIEIQGDSLIGRPEVSLTDRDLFTGASYENSLTKFSLSGMQSSILLDVEDRWRFRLGEASENTLRVYAQRAFAPPAENNARRGLALRALPALFLGGVALVGAIALAVTLMTTD